VHDDEDRGEIELRLRWAERIYEDDFLLKELKSILLIRLQSWARRISALSLLHKLKKERKNIEILTKANAIKITSICRMRMAKKKLYQLSRIKR
jgi:hypothetical protein